MKRHLKRLAAPKTWNIKRKKTIFITRPKPSGHTMRMSVSMNMFMKQMVGLAKTTKEVRTILHNKTVLVDGKQRKDHRFAVGFLDLIQVGETKETFRITLDNKGRITHINVPAKETNTKICKIIGKTAMKGKKIQLNLNDGKNFVVDAKEKCKVGDSVVLDLKANKITQYLSFDKDMTVVLTEGRYSGLIGKITAISEGQIVVKAKDGKEYRTRKPFGFVVGKAQPAISVE